MSFETYHNEKVEEAKNWIVLDEEHNLKVKKLDEKVLITDLMSEENLNEGIEHRLFLKIRPAFLIEKLGIELEKAMKIGDKELKKVTYQWSITATFKEAGHAHLYFSEQSIEIVVAGLNKYVSKFIKVDQLSQFETLDEVIAHLIEGIEGCIKLAEESINENEQFDEAKIIIDERITNVFKKALYIRIKEPLIKEISHNQKKIFVELRKNQLKLSVAKLKGLEAMGLIEIDQDGNVFLTFKAKKEYLTSLFA